MAAPHKTIDNPYGLTIKQHVVIADMIDDVKHGRPINAKKSTAKAYSANSENTLKSMTSENMTKPNFREALLEGLNNLKLIGKDSKIVKRLNQGIDATVNNKFGKSVDYKTRLAYIQEVNKITGVYAPNRSEKKSLNIKVNMSDKEFQDKINELKKDLTQQ